MAAKLTLDNEPDEILCEVAGLFPDHDRVSAHASRCGMAHLRRAFLTGKWNSVRGAVNRAADTHRAIAEGGGPSGATATGPPLGCADAPAGATSGTAACVAGGLPGSTTTRVPIFTRL